MNPTIPGKIPSVSPPTISSSGANNTKEEPHQEPLKTEQTEIKQRNKAIEEWRNRNTTGKKLNET
jgi:hypothetical protein